MNEAFRRLRSYSRATNTRLSALAADIVNGRADSDAVLAGPGTAPGR